MKILRYLSSGRKRENVLQSNLDIGDTRYARIKEIYTYQKTSLINERIVHLFADEASINTPENKKEKILIYSTSICHYKIQIVRNQLTGLGTLRNQLTAEA